MAFYPASSAPPRQLLLDLNLEDVPSAHSEDRGVKRSVIFPKNIQIFNVPEFQRHVSQLFEPFNINIEFRVTRQNRLEMRWSFPQEAIQYSHSYARADSHQWARLSPEENAAFEMLVLSFAGSSH